MNHSTDIVEDRPLARSAGTVAPRKGQQTRAAIIEEALAQASLRGLEGLTIGLLAEAMKMSKSGVFAHFGSREDLQKAVLKAYEQRFVEEVLKPAFLQPRGLPRLRVIVSLWMERMVLEASRGCLWLASASEYDDRPGPVRDELVGRVQAWQVELRRAVRMAIEEGHLRADTDIDVVLFQLYGVLLVVHHDARLIGDPQTRARACRVMDGIFAQHAAP